MLLLPPLLLLLLACPFARARVVGFSLDIEPPAGPESAAFVAVMAEYRWRLAGSGLLLSADAGTAWTGADYATTVNGTTKLLSQWLVDLCDESVLMDYDRNASNLLVRAEPYLDYADARPGHAVVVGVAVATPGAAPTWWQTASAAELEALIAAVDPALRAHPSFNSPRPRYAVFFAQTLWNATRAAPAPLIANETKTLWYLDDDWVYNETARADFFAFCRAQNVVAVYDAPHAGNRPHIGAAPADQALYVDFIHLADAAGIDVQFLSGLQSFDFDMAFIKSVNEGLAGNARSAARCTSDAQCSLNGVCSAGSGTCACDVPWTGAACDQLAFAAASPAAGRNVYNGSDPRNTWGGAAIVDPADGRTHLYMPIYPEGKLFGPSAIKHGVAAAPTGPFEWLEDLNISAGINPAALVFRDPATNRTVFSLWVNGRVYVAASPSGPFTAVERFSYPFVNPSPVFSERLGAFLMTNQRTTQLFSTPSIAPGSVWTVFGNISHAALPDNTTYFVEDPCLWIDKRGNLHIVNHAYAIVQYESCGASDVSAHFFSADGRSWGYSRQPWGHSIAFDDGATTTFVTLERPWLHFAGGDGAPPTHLVLASDAATGDAGCQNRSAPGDHPYQGHCPCDNCKFADHTSTTVVALATA